MKKVLTLSAALFLAPAAHAGGDWEIDWHSIDGGGTMQSAGGNWELRGTIGQPDATAANALGGGSWELTGGFWGLFSEFGGLLNQIFRDRFEDGG